MVTSVRGAGLGPEGRHADPHNLCSAVPRTLECGFQYELKEKLTAR